MDTESDATDRVRPEVSYFLLYHITAEKTIPPEQNTTCHKGRLEGRQQSKSLQDGTTIDGLESVDIGVGPIGSLGLDIEFQQPASPPLIRNTTNSPVTHPLPYPCPHRPSATTRPYRTHTRTHHAARSSAAPSPACHSHTLHTRVTKILPSREGRWVSAASPAPSLRSTTLGDKWRKPRLPPQPCRQLIIRFHHDHRLTSSSLSLESPGLYNYFLVSALATSASDSFPLNDTFLHHITLTALRQRLIARSQPAPVG